MDNREDETIELSCVDCGKTFSFTVEEQVFYAKKGFVKPKRCFSCRELKKERKLRGNKKIISNIYSSTDILIGYNCSLSGFWEDVRKLNESSNNN